MCQPRLGGNVIFSAPNWDIAPIFFVQIPLLNEHLFCKYFVRLSVGNATKALLLMDVFILVFNSKDLHNQDACVRIAVINLGVLEPFYTFETML